MNTKTLSQFFGSLVLCIGSSGCHREYHVRTQEQPSDPCADYGGLIAELGAATVGCTGTIGPDSFTLKDGLLQNQFTTCTGPQKQGLETVTKLLHLQSFPGTLPRYQECLTDRYKRWVELFARAELKSCPLWTEPTVIAEGDKASRTQLSKMQPRLPYVPATEKDPHLQPTPEERFVKILAPAKSSVLYKISYPQPEPTCDDPAVCAAQCAAFLPGFVVAAAGNQLLTDPASWYRDRFTQTCATPGTNDSWCPPYVHAMAITKTSPDATVPPGDIYGHPNRGDMGERCVRWLPPTGTTPGSNYVTDLVLECVAPGDCLSRCGN